MIKPLPAALVGMVLGIALGSVATAVITSTRQAQHRPPLAAGQPPAPAPAPVLQDRPEPPEVPAARPGPPPPPPEATRALQAKIELLEARAREHEKTITELREQVADEQAQRVEVEGTPVDWPADIPEKFRADALRTQLNAALKEVGYDGEVTEVDCHEYPCIVYGKINDDDGTTLEQLQETQAMAGYKNASNNTSAWGGVKKRADGDHREAAFGIALYPKEQDEARRGQIERRLRIRHQAFWDQVKADEAAPQ
jgi:hypothetical protein